MHVMGQAACLSQELPCRSACPVTTTRDKHAWQAKSLMCNRPGSVPRPGSTLRTLRNVGDVSACAFCVHVRVPTIAGCGGTRFPSLSRPLTRTWWIERMVPSDLHPPNLYLAQLAHRLAQPGKVSTLLGGVPPVPVTQNTPVPSTAQAATLPAKAAAGVTQPITRRQLCCVATP